MRRVLKITVGLMGVLLLVLVGLMHERRDNDAPLRLMLVRVTDWNVP